MTREAFLQLAGQLFDAMQGGSGGGSGKPPKFDTSLPAGHGMVIWASECSARELQYQLTKAQKPPSDPKWADSNAKRAKALGYFLTWRQSNPTECWVGERNRRTVTAKPPSDRPQKYARDAAPPEQSFADEPETTGAGASDMDDIPFAPLGDVG